MGNNDFVNVKDACIGGWVLAIKMAVLAAMLSASYAFAHGADGHNKHEEHAVTIGKPGIAAKVTRTVEVEMNDTMRFTPSNIVVKRGETIRFVIKNNGKLKHEMVLGSMAELKEHAALMLKFPEMEHDDPNLVSVEPGRTSELIWQFTQVGKFDFACLQPGHFEAEMVSRISVKSNATNDMKSNNVAGPMVAGEVKKADKEFGKLTIKHGPLAHLDMPAMTMVFRVKDPAMLDQIKPGDKINFSVERENGALTVTRIETAE